MVDEGSVFNDEARLSWKRYTITRSVMTLVELKFQKTIHQAFDRLRGELSSDDPEAEIAKSFLAFLDQSAQKILVRHRKSGRTFEASYFDAWYKRLLSANPIEHKKHVTSYLASAEGRLLLPYLDELRNAADEIGMQWERGEALLREALHEYGDRHGARRSPQKAQRSSLNSPPILGERDENVARRRTALRNMMRSRQPLHALEICAGWDDLEVPVPDRWQPDISKWQQALKKCPNRVHKLIWVDKWKIKERTT